MAKPRLVPREEMISVLNGGNVLRIMDMYDWGPNGSRTLGNHPMVPTYGLRAMPCGGQVVFPHDSSLGAYVDEYIHGTLGIQTHPHYARGLDMYQAIRTYDATLRAFIQRHVHKGGYVELFNTSRRGGEFVEALGIPVSRMLTAPVDVEHRYGDKLHDRIYSQDSRLPDIYAPYKVAYDVADVPDLCEQMFTLGNDRLIVRPTNLASAAGQIEVTRATLGSTEFLNYLMTMKTGHFRALLIEEFVHGSDFSVIWYALPDGRYALVTWTKQYSLHGKHLGNMIMKHPEDIRPHGLKHGLWHGVMEDVVLKTGPHVEAFVRDGGAGVVCFDARIGPEGFWVITEKNIRMTAGYLAFLASLQQDAPVVTTRNITLPDAMRWRDVITKLGKDAYDPLTRRNVCVTNPLACADPNSPMFTAYDYADSATGGEQRLDRVAQMFEGADLSYRYYQPQIGLISASSVA